MTRSVLFYRHFDQYSGGQQKVFDYFSHLRAVDEYQADISFSESSLWDDTNPWFPDYRRVDFSPGQYDYLFLAGMDWLPYHECGIDPDKPVINLIQHVRHARSDEDVYPFLKNKAIRICVSPEVEAAIGDLANGPITTIANGIAIPEIECEKTNDVYVAGYKNQALAKALADQLGNAVVCQTEHLPRREFLNQLAASRIAVVLPHPTEGFFLPALEAMKLADIAIVPDCVGNRSFCIDVEKDNGNCLMPTYDVDALAKAIERAKNILNDEEKLTRLKNNAIVTVNNHSLAHEREQFLELMSHVDELWHAG
jgi:hypothetical protein